MYLSRGATGESLIEMMALDMLVGSGGVLSHAPRREQSCAMLIDAFQPEGVTRLAVDSIFMMPSTLGCSRLLTSGPPPRFSSAIA